MKTILVPTDFSENAANALNYAIELAKREKASLLLLHVFHLDPKGTHLPLTLIEEDVKQEELKSNVKLKSLCTKVAHAGNVKCEILSKLDLAVDGILATAEEKAVDLIVMGTKGASGLTEVVFGSNTARIVEKAHCPVIAVPEGASYNPIKRMTFTTLYAKSDIPALVQLVEIAKAYDAQINVLHIAVGESDEAKAEMKKFMEEVNEKVNYNNLSFQLLYGLDVEEELEKFLRAEATDLLVMSTHKRDLLDKLFGKSLTKKMTYHSKVPVMAFHYKKKESTIII